MYQRYEPKPLKPPLLEMPGFSKKQIEEHYQLYLGYVNKTNEVRQKLETADRSTANATYSELRSLKLGEDYAWDGVKLHEWYFENLGGKGGAPTGHVASLIRRDFESIERWEADFKATGLAFRGWAVLAYDMHDKCLHNYGSDAHDVGIIWCAMPLLVLDVYEHAYMIDYGIKRAAYIDAFLKNVDWEVVNHRLHEMPGAPPMSLE